jgi:ATP phosphoribosyltransferase regulatory subunit
MESRVLKAPMPYGVRDVFGLEAAQQQALSDAWRRLFRAWGYDEVITPTYEHYDVLITGYGRAHEDEVYRVLDRDGAVLALRPDITTQVARLAATKLSAGPWPLRLFYAANVFRFAEPQAGRQREFFQAGVELLGAATPEADAEVIALVIEALSSAGLRDFQLNVGHIGIFQGLMADLGLAPAQAEEFRRAIDRKDAGRLERCLTQWSVPLENGGALRALPSLCGGPEVLERAGTLLGTSKARPALQNLTAVYRLLEARGVADRLILDLGEVRGMDYYTGLSFEGFVAGLGFPICSGGRYDNLVGLYGPPTPAVGFALGLERVQVALARKGSELPPRPPLLLVAAGAAAASQDRVRAWRSWGLRVEMDVMPRGQNYLLEYARRRGSDHILWSAEPEEATLLEGGRVRRLTWRELDREVKQWLA